MKIQEWVRKKITWYDVEQDFHLFSVRNVAVTATTTKAKKLKLKWKKCVDITVYTKIFSMMRDEREQQQTIGIKIYICI